MEAFIQELKEKIIRLLNFADLTPEDIRTDDPLVGGPLGIDSIDILELVIMLDRDYGVKITSRELGMKVFATLRSMAEHIQASARRLEN